MRGARLSARLVRMSAKSLSEFGCRGVCMFMTGRFPSETKLGGHEIEETAIDFRAGNAQPPRIF